MSHVKLGDLFRVGSSKRVLQSQWTTEGVPFYRGREITKLSECGFVENDLFITEELFNALSQRSGVPQAGDIMITAIGTIGNSYIVCPDDRFYFKDASVLWLARNSDVSSEYINHWLKSPLFLDQLDRGNGATVDTLTIQKLQGVLVHVPSASEQRRIVTHLDEAFADIATAKANAEKNLQNARALFESHLDASFGRQNESWTEKALQDIGSTQTGSTPKTSDQANYGDELPFIKPGDFAPDGTLNYENDGLSAQGAASARKVSANSVLMVCIGATIGKCGYAEREIATNQQINAFTPVAGVDKKFIYYQMLTKRFQDRVIHSSGQATLPIINKSKWSALTIYLPGTLGEQEAIAKKMDFVREETQRLECIYRQKLTALDDLKKSLLYQAFSGQL